MVFRTFEPWVSKKEVCKYFNFSTKYLERKYPIFSKGIHFMYKDPLNENGHRVWKISKVEQLLCDNSSGLARRLKRVKWPAQTSKITSLRSNFLNQASLFTCLMIFSTWNSLWNFQTKYKIQRKIMELHEEFRFWTLIKKAEAIKATIRNQTNPVLQFFLKLFLYHSFMKTAQEIQDTFWCGEEVSISKIDQLPSFIRRDYFFH